MTSSAKTAGAAVLMTVLVSVSAVLSSASDVPPTLLGSDAAARNISTQRFYVAIPGGDGARLTDIFHKLDAAGARRIHAFLPDLIVCEVPVTVSAHAVAGGSGVIVVHADEAHEKLSGVTLRTKPATVERALAETTRIRAQQTVDSSHQSHGDWYPGETRRIPIEAMYESARRAGGFAPSGSARGGSARGGSEQATTRTGVRDVGDARMIHQNSELMIGNILVNIVLPESDYPPAYYETWSTEAINQVHYGFILAMDLFMEEFENADIGVIYKYHDQVLVNTEPINHTPAEDDFWITLCMNSLGYLGPKYDVLNTVHEFNDELRRTHRTDWVFTAFLALAEKKWTGPYFTDARSISWGYLGGPYYVSSYPAGKFRWAEGVRQIARHEIGHIFWGLEEDKGTVSLCEDRSGYLNVVNGNKVVEYSPTGFGRKGCGDESSNPIPCVQNEYDQLLFGWDPGACRYTQETWGVSDLNDNGVPDALDLGPVIEFLTAEVETVLTQVGHFDVRVRAVPIPNDNPLQPEDLRRDYAARIRDIDVSVSGLTPYTIEPASIGSNGYVAEFRVFLPPFIPGRLDIDVGARNVYYAKSPTRTKEYRYVHLKYLGFEVEHPNEGIRLSWTMLGEIFDARFALHRRNNETGETVVVAEEIAPTGPTKSGITPFEILDDDTEPGVEYTYRVSGTIDLPNSAGLIHKVVDSNPIGVQGAVARTRTPSSLISNVAPNPFSTLTWLSMDIPHPDAKAPTDGSTAARDAAMRVNVTVYDVRGSRVSRLFERGVIDDVLTISWDGTDDRGRALPSGVYFMRVNVAGTIETRKVMLVR